MYKSSNFLKFWTLETFQVDRSLDANAIKKLAKIGMLIGALKYNFILFLLLIRNINSKVSEIMGYAGDPCGSKLKF